jgi:hypothetical protein
MQTSNLILLVTPTQQNLVDYFNAVAKVNNYAYAITQTSLPVINQPPQYYADFTTEFSPAKAHVLVWTNSIFPNMLSLPRSILDTKFLFELNESSLQQTLEYLQKNPTSTDAKNTLNRILTLMQQNIKAQITVVEGIETNLNTFATQLVTDATTLNDMATQALEAAGADQAQINKLNQDIDTLNNDINNLNLWIKVSMVGTDLSIFISLIGVAVASLTTGGVGAAVAIIIFGAIGGVASAVGQIVIKQKIQDDQNTIENDSKQVSSLNQDVIALQALNKQFEYLVTANQVAQEALTTIKTMWTNLDNDLGDVIKDLTDFGTDVTSAQYAQALADLTAAQTAWNEVVTFATALQGISYKWKDKDGNWHDYADEPPMADSSSVTLIKSAA